MEKSFGADAHSAHVEVLERLPFVHVVELTGLVGCCVELAAHRALEAWLAVGALAEAVDVERPEESEALNLGGREGWMSDVDRDGIRHWPEDRPFGPEG